MKTRIALTALTSLAAILACAFPARAQTSSPAPATGVDASGFFRLGENYEAQTWSSYFALIGEKAAERGQSFHALAAKLGAPQDVLADLDAHIKASQGLPFDKPYSTWPEEAKKKWDTVLFDWSKWKSWLDKPDYEPLFFFFLGQDSFKGSFAIGRDVIENNVAPQALSPQVKVIADGAAIYLSDTNYAKAFNRLVPEAVKAIKVLASFKKFEDPLNDTPLNRDDVTKLSDACKTLSSLARENKLVAPTSSSQR